ncbi:probable calcium-binding protein CML41 [Diospyros lotus]|uniref:probable calcium-binding protein CML41 n=1 Tax=Diospyros lotus TaxID=55363 RepID=UPI00225B97F6|nr:probable calcium-binding protein CML41 [Diospyros lotus]
MEAGGTAPKSFGCFPLKGARGGLKLSLQRLRSKSSSTGSRSSRSPPPTRAPTSPSPSIRPHIMPTAREDDEFRQVFGYFDSDDDGKISAVELRAYFGSIGQYMSHEEAQVVINDFDSDGDGLIDMEDFLRLMKRDVKGDDNYKDDLKAAFQMFELHKGSGRITPKSLQRALSRLGEVNSYDECKAMIQVFDTDGNGELDFHEFHRMMA